MRKCIDSILAQTFQDYECLLIDDGSKDGSPAICDEYAAKDERFKVFHKPNGGLSDARNYGIEHARGEYTIFFDPDDWVDKECLKDMYAKALETDADMVMCGLYYNDPHHQNYSPQKPTGLHHKTVLEDILRGKVHGFTVTKLIRRELYTKYDLQYPTGMYGCEDQYTICKLLKNDIKIEYIPIAYYHYMHYGQDSLSRHYDETTYQHDLSIRDLFVELVQEYPVMKQIAWEKKSLYLVVRAFKYGQNYFSNKQFKKTFYSYQELVKASEMPNKELILTYLSCCGGFHFWNRLFWKGYQAKQILKKIKWNLKR